MNRTHAALALATLAALGLSAVQPAAAQQTLYVSNATYPYTIEKFTPGGIASTFASDPGNYSVLNTPEGLAFDSAGNLYATNLGGETIEAFTPGGVGTVFASTGLSSPTFLAFSPTPAPEPSPLAALGLGVLGLCTLALRARKRRPA